MFVLGFPYALSLLGSEVKLTDGKISSQSGFQGYSKTYQISAPIQPGNSGGPLFNDDGDVIGVVSSKFTEGENVGYAIKSDYLLNLLESNNINYNNNNS
ncbi:MAG: trypsin-like peptidase domain-containing protein, partial [Schleiferiaceae bacterium]